MHFESHAGLGWLLGSAAPGSDRRLRAWCVAAAVLPDVDAAAYLFGDIAYGRYHHTFGHNVFLGAACVAAAAWQHRDRPPRRRALAALLVAAAFASHLLTDAKLSAYLVRPFWPLSDAGYEFHPNLGLGAPINTWLVCASLAAVLAIACWRRVTPLELLSPRLDGASCARSPPAGFGPGAAAGRAATPATAAARRCACGTAASRPAFAWRALRAFLGKTAASWAVRMARPPGAL